MADYNQNNPYNQNSQTTQGGSFSSSGAGQNGTSREDQLKKLGQQLNQNKNGKKKGSKWIIIILILLLIGLAVFAIWFFLQGKTEIQKGGYIRVSMEVPEEIEGSASDIYTKKQISPGDEWSVECWVRNSKNFKSGDSDGEENQQPIYVRYRIALEVDGTKYYDLLTPNIDTNAWYSYNEELDGDYVWDNYYYYYGELVFNASAVRLFNKLTFDFHKIPNEFGGKSGKIIIEIEAVEANKDVIGVDNGAWETAPSRWVERMKNGA